MSNVNLEKNIGLALETLSIDKEQYFCHLKSKYKMDEMDFINLDCSKAIEIAYDLAIDLDMLLFHYDRKQHINRVCHAIKNKNYNYKATVEINNHLKLIEEVNKKTIVFGRRFAWESCINKMLKASGIFSQLQIKLPTSKTLFNQTFLRHLALGKILLKRWWYLKRNGSLQGFLGINREFGMEINCIEDEIHYSDLNKLGASTFLFDRNDNLSPLVKSIDQYSQDPKLDSIMASFWRESRIKIGLSQDAVAKALGQKSKDLVVRWEKGFSVPSNEDIPTLLNLYSVSTNDYVNFVLTLKRKELFALLKEGKKETLSEEIKS